jgi:hypothetical protein
MSALVVGGFARAIAGRILAREAGDVVASAKGGNLSSPVSTTTP